MTRQRLVLTVGTALVLAGSPLAAQQQPGTVTIPLGDYERLLDRAARPTVRPEAPPIAATVASASIVAEVGNGVVRGTIDLTGEVFATGGVKVPLLTGAVLTSAERTGKPLALLVEGATHAAILHGPEPFTLRLAFALPVTQEPGRASCQLPVPLARSTRLSLEIPRGHAEVLLEGGLVTKPTTAQDGKTRIEATLEPGRAARISWTVRDVGTAAAPREARFVSAVSTLASVGEIDLRLAVMLDVSVIMGQPTTFQLKLPEGFELVNGSGVSLDSAKTKDGVLTLAVSDPSRRRHQFLLALERTAPGGLLEAEVPIVSLLGAQRETGELAVEGLGTMELTAKEQGTLRRMDSREAGPALRALARLPLLAAFRYHQRPAEPPRLLIQAQRFPDAPVLAALAEHAIVTTLVTAEGRTLSEVSLSVRNQAQPYLRVALPQGATLVSAAIEGVAVKPVEGADGARVPLLRPGFRPSGPYTVSFVYMGAGSAFGKKGEARLTLARMDLPISALYWEMFVPDKYKVKDFGGEAWRDSGGWPEPAAPSTPGGFGGGAAARASGWVGGPGISGEVTDPTGATVSGAKVTVTNEATGVSRTANSNAQGRYTFGGLPPGSYRVEVEFAGFKLAVQNRVGLAPGGSKGVDFRLETGAITETVSVEAGNQYVPPWAYPSERKVAVSEAPPQSVVDLQRRVAGVLPVRIDVPRTGTSLRFVRPLVLDEETTVTFEYKTR